MKKILVISDNYPVNSHPNRGVFVYQLLDEFSKCNEVKVISPRVKFKDKDKSLVKIEQDQRKVLYPTYFSFAGYFNQISQKSKETAILKSYKNISEKPDYIYAHFLWNAIASMPLKKKINCPMFVAMGESTPSKYDKYINNIEFKRDILDEISGFICVSDKLSHYLNQKLKVPKEKIIVVPNGVNTKRFYPMDKMRMREKHNLPKEKLVLSFIGAFNERKGIHDILDVIKEEKDICAVLIGKGTIDKDSKVVFANSLPHHEISEYLNASDVFIFPTRAEGSSNALLEAAACGLPIITSNIAEVFNQLGANNAKFVTPGNVLELQKEIEFFRCSKNRKNFGERSLEVAKKYSIQKRSEIILNWINDKI